MDKSLKKSIEELRNKKKKASLGGGKDRTKKQHDKGRLTARERVDMLLDKDSFVELGREFKHRCFQRHSAFIRGQHQESEFVSSALPHRLPCKTSPRQSRFLDNQCRPQSGNRVSRDR